MTNQTVAQLETRLSSIIRGKPSAVRMAIVALLGRGNLLIEDVPGVGKTTLAFALARAVDCSFQRIQFTSDLMPSDIIGVSVYRQERGDFDFRPGPLFANIVLADEVNRTSPRTQSALLEAMNERRVTVERHTLRLPEPFMIIATQNPVEFQGTFPLPESQLDRFMMRIRLGYPAEEDERAAVTDPLIFDALDAMPPVVSRDEIIALQNLAEKVFADESVVTYLLQVVAGTRSHASIRLGVSTRGAQFLLRAARALACCEGRDYVVPDDVRELVPLVLAHRILLKPGLERSAAEEVLDEIIARTPVPV